MKFHLKNLLFILISLITSLSVNAQDLSGTWEGQRTMGGKIFNYTFYLKKIDNAYLGVSTFKEALIQGKIVSIGGMLSGKKKIDLLSKKSSAKSQMVAAFANGVLSYTDIGLLSSNVQNTRLESGNFVYVQLNEKEKLVDKVDPSFKLTKKSNDFPDEYNQYKNSLVSLSDIRFVNSNKGTKIKYNDKGLLSLTITNNSDFDLQNINISMHVQEENSGILGLDNNSGTFSLAKSKSISPEIDVYSGFNLPASPLHLTVVASYNGVVLFDKEVELLTMPFYLNDQTVISQSSQHVLSVLRGYYGLNNAPCTSIVTGLDQFAASGNKLAPMWKAVFLMKGKGGYTKNEAQALQLATKAYNDVLEGARNGDAECQYLMVYAVGLGLAGDPSGEVGKAFLKRSAEAGFLPAMYDYAFYLMNEGNYEDSYKYLTSCYDKGMQRAIYLIGYFNEKGYAVDKNSSKAIEWYHKGETFGDADAIMQLANVYSSGEDDIEPNAPKAMIYAAKAAALKNTRAIDFMAEIYLNGRNGVSKNSIKAIELYKESANLGDSKAMTALAFLYYYGSNGITKDNPTMLFWARRSAESGGADCMVLLSSIYSDGKIVPKDAIKERFWRNQAQLNGVGQKDNTAQNVQKAQWENFVSNLDFSDHYSYFVDEDNNLYRQNDGSNLLGSMAQSLFTGFFDRQSQHQDVIDGLEYIYTSGGKKIYGATLTSKFVTDIYLKAGQQIKLKAYGTVNLGFFAGVGNADGISGFQSYCIDPSIPHGAIMGGTGGTWTFIGADNTYTATQDGKLQLAINDADYSNNQGYFDVVLTSK